MNDEEFARRAFAETFGSDQPEPVADLDVSRIASRGRRSARTRSGLYAAGTTALAGVVTAGIVIGPGFIHTPHSSTLDSAAGGSATADPAASTPAPSGQQPSGGPTCHTDLAAIAGEDIPASLHATLSGPATCVQEGLGNQTAQVQFDIPGDPGALQITVGVGTGSAGSSVGSAPNGSAANPPASKVPGQPLSSASLDSLRAKKLALAGMPVNGQDQPLSSASVSALQAQKFAAGAAAATNAAAPMNGQPQESCQPSTSTGTVCVRPVVKGPMHVIVVDLTRSSTSTTLAVQIVASSTTDVPPMTTPQLTSLARSLAGHF